MDDASIDLIYLDPPYNSNKDRAAPIGSAAAGAAFKDTWSRSDMDDAWAGEIADRNPAVYAACQAARMTHGDSMYSYLCMMAPRLLEMRRVLKDTGSIYLHCDWYADSYLRLLLDAIFGKDNLRNEIVWCYTGPANVRKQYPRKHDTLLFYSASEKTVFNRDAVRIPYKHLANGAGFGKAADKKRLADLRKAGKVPESWWINVHPCTRGSKERTGYDTQKPLALLRRIILASSNPGDLVLDPFCGCATACVAADMLGREWIGIDLSEAAVKLVKHRLDKHHGMFAEAAGVTLRTDIPQRSDAAKLPNYRTHRHTLYGKQEGNCAGCGIHFPYRNMTTDHIVPRSKGGDDRISNLQLLCGACNSVKGDRDMAYLLNELKKQVVQQQGIPENYYTNVE